MRYAFDNSVSRGPAALIGWLGLLSLVIVITGAAVLVLLGLGPADGEELSPPEAAWQALMRAIDAGGVGADSGWTFRLIMLLVTIGGVFVVSTLIGVLTAGIEGRLEQLRKGRSLVVESDHTLILGWSQKVFTIIGELAVANANVSHPRVVVLADQDKVEMEDQIRDQLGDRLGRTKVICRSGSPLSPIDLAIASPSTARSIVVLTPEEDETDRMVLRVLLALTDPELRPPGSNHIVATLNERSSLEVTSLVAGDEARLLHVGDLVSRITAQSCRQSGLSVVYLELLDFDGVEIYFHDEPSLVGRTYHDALHGFDSSTVMGVMTAEGVVHLNPPMDTTIVPGWKLVVIAEDDDTTQLAAQPATAQEELIISADTAAAAAPEKTLLLGWNRRAPMILSQLDAYVPAGSTVDVVASNPDIEAAAAALAANLSTLQLQARQADITRRSTLAALPLATVDHIVILAEESADSVDEADTDTLVTLLHLRDLATLDGHDYSIVTEVLDSRNRSLIQTTSADDFIVSDHLISLLLAQICEHAALAEVFTDLFDPEGSEIYLKPAGEYVRPDVATVFATVVEAAARRGETAIGYRLAAQAGDAGAGYGVVVSPPKSTPVVLGVDDRIIVLAED